MTGPTRGPRSTRQWVLLGFGAVLVTLLCLVAARWQWHRYVDREAQIHRIESNYHATPTPISRLVAGPRSSLDPADVWRPATLRGHYEPDATVLLRNRPVDGSPGFHVLVPFVVTDDGGRETMVLIVDRGVVSSTADASDPSSVPAPPPGEVSAVVTLRADEPASTKSAPAGQVQRINTAQVLAAGRSGAGWASGLTTGAYGQVRTERPAAAQALTPLDPPDTDPGSHLSYTFQWCVFALGAIVGFLVLVRRERRERKGITALTAGDLLTGAMGRPARGGPRRPTAEEEEDALIDAQLGPEPWNVRDVLLPATDVVLPATSPDRRRSNADLPAMARDDRIATARAARDHASETSS